MSFMSDEQILYGCYLRLGKKMIAKKSNVSAAEDNVSALGIASNVSLTLAKLTCSDIILSGGDIRKAIITAKGLYLHYSMIKGRNPSSLNMELSLDMDRLIRAVCAHEAEMIHALRLRLPDGNLLEIQSVFEEKKNQFLAQNLHK